MARFILITTTREDLERNGYPELINYRVDPGKNSEFPLNCFRKYNQEIFTDPSKNGLPLPEDYYFYGISELWVYLDKDGFEVMSDCYPCNLDDEYVDDVDYIYLPSGFIESWCGRKLTKEDKPILYNPYKFEDLDIWKE